MFLFVSLLFPDVRFLKKNKGLLVKVTENVTKQLSSETTKESTQSINFYFWTLEVSMVWIVS